MHSGRTWLVAGSASLVLLAGCLTVVLHDHGHRGGQTTLRIADEPLPTPEATAPPIVAALPSAVPSALPEPPSPRVVVPVPSATAVPTGVPVDEQCLRPARPDDRPDASCDALHPHAGLPHPCLGLGNACEWPDARGVVTGGCFDIAAAVRVDSVRATWRISDDDLKGNQSSGPVHHMVVTLADHDGQRAFVQRVLPAGTTSTVFEGVAPGDYQVMFQELNDSGLSNSTGRYATVAGASPSPVPTSSPTPDTTPSPGPTDYS